LKMEEKSVEIETYKIETEMVTQNMQWIGY
jgi:hypothetical protein